MAMALAERAWEVVNELLGEEDGKLRLDAARLVLEYAHGKPRQSVDIDVRDEASRYAAILGIPATDLVAEAARLAAEAAN